MELKRTVDLLENLPMESKTAIAELIDLKTNDNMKEVIAEIRSLRLDMDSKFAAIDTKFDAKFDSVEMRIKTLYWILGVCVVPVLVYVFKSFF